MGLPKLYHSRVLGNDPAYVLSRNGRHGRPVLLGQLDELLPVGVFEGDALGGALRERPALGVAGEGDRVDARGAGGLAEVVDELRGLTEQGVAAGELLGVERDEDDV